MDLKSHLFNQLNWCHSRQWAKCINLPSFLVEKSSQYSCFCCWGCALEMWLEILLLCYSLEPVAHQYLLLWCKISPILRIRVNLVIPGVPLTSCVPSLLEKTLCHQLLCVWGWALFAIEISEITVFVLKFQKLGCSLLQTRLQLPSEIAQSDIPASAVEHTFSWEAECICMDLKASALENILLHRFSQSDKAREI